MIDKSREAPSVGHHLGRYGGWSLTISPSDKAVRGFRQDVDGFARPPSEIPKPGRRSREDTGLLGPGGDPPAEKSTESGEQRSRVDRVHADGLLNSPRESITPWHYRYPIAVRGCSYVSWGHVGGERCRSVVTSGGPVWADDLRGYSLAELLPSWPNVLPASGGNSARAAKR